MVICSVLVLYLNYPEITEGITSAVITIIINIDELVFKLNLPSFRKDFLFGDLGDLQIHLLLFAIGPLISHIDYD